MAITKVSNSVLNLSGNTDALGLPKGTDAQRPTPVAGMLRFNTETSGFEGYDGTEWGAIGGTGSTLVQDEFTGDGTTVAFTLSVSVEAEVFTSIYINGVYQEKSAYGISGTTLTFEEAPPSASSIEVITIDNITISGEVSSVNSKNGVVVLDSDDISEGSTNKYLLDDSVTYEKVGNEFKSILALTPGTVVNVDFDSSAIFTLTPTTTTTLNVQNPKIGSSKIFLVTGSGTGASLLFSLEGGSGIFNLINGEYDDTSAAKNFIQMTCVSSTEFWYSISQTA
jgi:hypothetical protein